MFFFLVWLWDCVNSSADCARYYGPIIGILATGASAAALDVLTGVAAEFLLNLGRTLRFLCDKYAQTMTPEVCMRTSFVYLTLTILGNHSACAFRKRNHTHTRSGTVYQG